MFSGWLYSKFIDMAKSTKKSTKKTYDVHFNDDRDSNNKGFEATIAYCKHYIKQNNGTNTSYFKDYKGGTVSVVCNQTGETKYVTIDK
jgi:hypothetical protein